MKNSLSLSKLLILITGIFLLVACQPQQVEVTRVVEVEGETVTEVQEVEVTRVVEGEVVTEVQEIEVTRVVEVEGEAEDTSMQSPYPNQYGSLADYEAATGNTIDSYQEAPMLAEMDLPPVEERLPSDPVVVQPLSGTGVYGGELAGPSTNPTCCGWDVLEMRLQKLFTVDTDLASIIPNIAKSIEISDDQTTFTISIREGHKWSDGEPFTTEDFRFYFEDIVSNEEVSPAPYGLYVADGEIIDFEIIDETTVKYTFPEPNPSFLIALGTEVMNRGYRPAHYFKQFHIDYNPDANALAEEEGFENWVSLLNSKMRPYNFTWDMGSDVDPYAPTLNSFVFVSEDTFGNKLYERNPYFFKVDTEGNQLPYTDTLRRILVEDLEVQDLKAIAGEYSHFGWGSLLSVPTYRANEDAGNYRTSFVRYNRGNEYALTFNYTSEDLGLREIFWDVRFRQAMSIAINRNEINELVYLGLATASQASPTPASLYYEPWMTDYFAEYNPDEANRLLDEMGLDQRDSDGFRLRPDGSELLLNFQVSVPEEAWQRIGELIVDYWNAVGIKTNYKLIESGLYTELRDGNNVDLAAWGYDSTDIGDLSTGLSLQRPSWGSLDAGHPWEDWLVSDGENGEEPPEEIKELWELSEGFLSAPYGSEEQLAIGKEFYNMSYENLYVIGTIQLPPQPLLFKNDLCNTPGDDSEGLWSWSYRQWVLFMPEQWYFAPSGTCQ